MALLLLEDTESATYDALKELILDETDVCTIF